MRKVIGCLLVCVGVVMLLCFIPFWVWLGIIGAILIGLGCFILIRGC